VIARVIVAAVPRGDVDALFDETRARTAADEARVLRVQAR
jgi:hypothetical protein